MYSGIIPIIKQAAVDAVNASQPVNIVFGTVTSVSPLKVQITPKLVLGKDNLVVAGSLKATSLTFSDSGQTGSADGHSHSFNTSDTVTLDNSLKKGDSVIMLRVQGGQQYVVLDKVV